MSIAFKTVKTITIPEGSVKKITNSAGVVIWQKQKLYSYQKFVAYEWGKYSTQTVGKYVEDRGTTNVISQLETEIANSRSKNFNCDSAIDDDDLTHIIQPPDPDKGKFSFGGYVYTWAEYCDSSVWNTYPYGYTDDYMNNRILYYVANRSTAYVVGTKIGGTQTARNEHISDVTSANRSAYPDDGLSGDYWYIYKQKNFTTVTSEYKLSEGAQTTLTMNSSSKPKGYASIWVDTDGSINGNEAVFERNWRDRSSDITGSYVHNYNLYKSRFPYIYYPNGSTGGSSSGDTEDAGTLDTSTSGYKFTKDSDGYYVSSNAGANSSYSYGKLIFNFTSAKTVTLTCVSYGENNCDYGIIGNLDKELAKSNSADSSNVFHSFKGESSSIAKTFTMEVPAGTHYITFKYIKDSSAHSNGDYFKLKATAPADSGGSSGGASTGWYKIISATSSSATVVPLTTAIE